MSRSKLRPRLEDLASNVNLAGRDREFAESLLEHYNKRGSLTAGRRVWIDRLEARAKENSANPPDTNEAMMSRIDRILSLTEGDKTWDRGFVESVRDQQKFRGTLSPRQLEIFQTVEEKYSEEAVNARVLWEYKYLNEGLKENALICAHYYAANPPYYSALAARILGCDDYVPDENQYKKMCENKYSLRVISETLNPPLYNVGDLVVFRARHSRKGKMASVIQIAPEPVSSSAKGSKKYSVLVFGGTKPITVEERDVKKYRGKRNSK